MPAVTSPDPTRLRHVLGHVPTPVVVVAGYDDDPVGMAVGSFASISLDPALVGFFVDHASSTWPRVARAGSFAVNVLADDQEELCRRFATKGADRFADVSWRSGHGGAPLLDGALAWIECDLEDVVETGDHHLAIGAVRHLDVRDSASPLVFHRRGFARVALPEPARPSRPGDALVRRVVETSLPLAAGAFRAIGYESVGGRAEHVALVLGDPAVPIAPRHVHRRCGGEALDLCGCRARIDRALAGIAAAGAGALVLLGGEDRQSVAIPPRCAAPEASGELSPLQAELARGIFEDLGLGDAVPAQ